MSWTELRVEMSRSALDAASALLFDLGSSGLEESDLAPRPIRQVWDGSAPADEPERLLLRAYFEDPDQHAVERALAGLEGVGRASWHSVADTNWEEAWREGLDPIVVSERLVVAPPWNAPPGALVIEPGQGFGTGQHPSTRACLAAVDEIVRSDPAVRTCLDVGAGSGILALAAARLGLSARGIDTEESAVADARANAARNGLDAVSFDATPIAKVLEPADIVLANLHAEVLVALAPDLVRLTRRWLVVAGVLADREAKVRAAFEPALELVSRAAAERWVSLRYRRPAPCSTPVIEATAKS